MHRIQRRPLVTLALTGLALFSIACPQQEASIPLSEEPSATSPGGGSEPQAQSVVIEITRFDVLDWAPPAIDVAAEGEGEGEGADAVAAEAAEEGEELGEEEVPEQGPRTATILFELLVRFNGPGEAPEGVNLDIVHSDPSSQEKGRFQEWLVTHEMEPGEERQDYVEFEIPGYEEEEGDAFSVAIAPYVPP